MADPLSIAASVVSLIAFGLKVVEIVGNISQDLPLSDTISEDTRRIRRDLLSLCGILQQLEGLFDNSLGNEGRLPGDLTANLRMVLDDCLEVFREWDAVVRVIAESDNIAMRKVRWVMKKKEMEKLSAALETRKATLNLSVMIIVNFSTSKVVSSNAKIEQGTRSIHNNTETIIQMINRLLLTLDDDALDQLSVAVAGRSDASSVVLRRFLEEATSYAETIRDGLDAESSFEEPDKRQVSRPNSALERYRDVLCQDLPCQDLPCQDLPCQDLPYQDYVYRKRYGHVREDSGIDTHDLPDVKVPAPGPKTLCKLEGKDAELDEGYFDTESPIEHTDLESTFKRALINLTPELQPSTDAEAMGTVTKIPNNPFRTHRRLASKTKLVKWRNSFVREVAWKYRQVNGASICPSCSETLCRVVCPTAKDARRHIQRCVQAFVCTDCKAFRTSDKAALQEHQRRCRTSTPSRGEPPSRMHQRGCVQMCLALTEKGATVEQMIESLSEHYDAGCMDPLCRKSSPPSSLCVFEETLRCYYSNSPLLILGCGHRYHRHCLKKQVVPEVWQTAEKCYCVKCGQTSSYKVLYFPSEATESSLNSVKATASADANMPNDILPNETLITHAVAHEDTGIHPHIQKQATDQVDVYEDEPFLVPQKELSPLLCKDTGRQEHVSSANHEIVTRGHSTGETDRVDWPLNLVCPSCQEELNSEHFPTTRNLQQHLRLCVKAYACLFCKSFQFGDKEALDIHQELCWDSYKDEDKIGIVRPSGETPLIPYACLDMCKAVSKMGAGVDNMVRNITQHYTDGCTRAGCRRVKPALVQADPAAVVTVRSTKESSRSQTVNNSDCVYYW